MSKCKWCNGSGRMSVDGCSTSYECTDCDGTGRKREELEEEDREERRFISVECQPVCRSYGGEHEEVLREHVDPAVWDKLEAGYYS